MEQWNQYTDATACAQDAVQESYDAARECASDAIHPPAHNRRATDVTAALWERVSEHSRESAVHQLVVALLGGDALRVIEGSR